MHYSRTILKDLVDLPSNKSVVGCKQVFKIKTRSNGSIERYKTHLVAKGCTKDYEETFASVARLSSICTLFATSCHWNIFQMDVKNVFLIGIGDLSEEVYMSKKQKWVDLSEEVYMSKNKSGVFHKTSLQFFDL